MKNVIKSFAVIAASLLTFNACQRELAPERIQEELFYITFVAEEPATKTTVEQGTDGEGNKVANYSWTASDANSERWTVYRGSDVAQSVIATLSQDGKMTVSAGFASASTTGDSFVALFNKGVGAVQNISAESVYDPASDVMVSAPVPFVAGESEYGFRFKRLGAIGKATVKGLTGMTALVDAKLIATDGTIIAADYDVENKTFAATGSTKITVKDIDCYPDASNNFSFYFITVPSESVELKLLAKVWDDQLEERLFVKQFARPITGFSEGDVFAFNVSGFTEVTTKANFNINGEVTSKPVYEGELVEFPEAPATIAGYDFVGWGTDPISGTQQEAPELVETSTEVMGNADVTYYAVYAKTTGHGTATHTITYDTENIPSSYGDAADVVLEGVTFNVTQMYKNGEKMQWRASQGTMYNKDAFASIQSVAITYGADNYKNFTVKVGDSANPTSGTSITAAQVGQTATYIYDCSASASDYFVLANGSNAGYLTSIVITYLGGAPTYEDYCTSIDTRTVTSLAWSAPTATVKLNGDDNEYPELTGDPEEVLAGVVYSSSETSVADINESGVVTLKAVGETTITAAFPDDDPNYQPSSASYTLVVTAPAKHTVTFSINGNTSSEEVDEGDPIEFPDDPEITGVVFRGWTKNAIVGTQAQAPEMVDTDEETMGNADVTYYAVFATETEGTIEWVEATLSSLTTSDVFVMASGTNAISSANGTSGNPPAVALTVSAGKITSEVTDVIKWTLTGNASSGYTFYKNGTQNYLYVNTTASSSSNPCIRVGTQSSNIRNNWKPDNNGYLKTNDSYTARYLSFYSDGPDFRGYTNTNNGAFAPTCYKKVNVPGYTNYCTTVVVLSRIEVSGTPTKTTYEHGEALQTAGLTLTAFYSDNSTAPVTEGIAWSVTPETLTYGTTSCNVTATALGKTSATYTVNGLTVNAPIVLTGIEVSGTPTKTSYRDGEAFETAGLVVKAVYSNGNKETVTEGIVWSVSPETLTYVEGTETYSVEVTATALEKTSAVYEVNGLTVSAPVTLTSISVKTAPTKVIYTEEENFNPAGLVIYKNYSDESKDELAYAGNESSFSFNPALDAALQTSNTAVTITCSGYSVDQAITVNPMPTFASLEDLVAADLTSGTKVRVTFENVPIKSIYVNSQSKRQGVYFDIQKDGHDIEIYYTSEDVPQSWAVEGTLSGTMICPWTYYERGTTWELAPVANSWSWSNLTYKAPLEPCAPPVISITDAGSATISCGTDGATIYYTKGASPADPTNGSTRYTGAVSMTDGETIKAIAYKDGMKPSTVASKKYTNAPGITAGKSYSWALSSNSKFTGWDTKTTVSNVGWTPIKTSVNGNPTVGNFDSARGQQFGAASNNQMKTLTIKGTGYATYCNDNTAKGITNLKIALCAKSGNTVTPTAKVGGVALTATTTSATIDGSTAASVVTFEFTSDTPLDGEIEFTISISSAGAIYVKSIAINN